MDHELWPGLERMKLRNYSAYTSLIIRGKYNFIPHK